MLVLTPDIANQVRGLTKLGHALAPVLLTNGNFILPESVLLDPAHAIHHELLDQCERVPDEVVMPKPGPDDPMPKIGVPYVETDPELTAPHTYSSDWPPGEIIVV